MILICFGTRPEYIKLKPLMDKMNGSIKYQTLFTGQHQDLINIDRNIDYKISINDGDSRLDSIVASSMNALNFDNKKISSVLVQGDTTSAYAMALSAFHNKIPVIHLEAGLRTYNFNHPYPEETNRQMISRIASVHLCPTQSAKQNLIAERVGGIVKVVGNTVLDNLSDIRTTNKKQVLITMHRRENHDKLDEWFTNLNKLAQKYDDYIFTLPIHPNPNVKQHRHILKDVRVVDPMSHEILLQYLANCSYVITDSGGIQEEAAFLKKPCIVCRKETERSEGIGNFSILCKDPKQLYTIFKKSQKLKMRGRCPYGNGKSCDKIVQILKKAGLGAS